MRDDITQPAARHPANEKSLTRKTLKSMAPFAKVQFRQTRKKGYAVSAFPTFLNYYSAQI
jgi:hypothetical protein